MNHIRRPPALGPKAEEPLSVASAQGEPRRRLVLLAARRRRLPRRTSQVPSPWGEATNNLDAPSVLHIVRKRFSPSHLGRALLLRCLRRFGATAPRLGSRGWRPLQTPLRRALSLTLEPDRRWAVAVPAEPCLSRAAPLPMRSMMAAGEASIDARIALGIGLPLLATRALPVLAETAGLAVAAPDLARASRRRVDLR